MGARMAGHDSGGSVFLAVRWDGFGERLRAICSAMALAELKGGSFRFTWDPSRARVPHPVLDLAQTFSADFAARHFIADPESLPPGPAYVTVTQTGLARLAPELAPDDVRARLGAAFAAIGFAPPLAAAITAAQAVALPGACTALHLRAGDIVYGRFNRKLCFSRKGLPHEIARHLIGVEQGAGRQVVLFGQDAGLIAHLARVTGAVTAARLTPPGPAGVIPSALYDMALMARCDRIIAGDSGFAALAGVIGRARQVAATDLVPQDRALALIHAGLARPPDPDISPEQANFSIAWALADNTDSLTDVQIHALLDRAVQTDPGNAMFRFLQAARHYAAGNIVAGEAVMTAALALNRDDPIRRYFRPDLYAPGCFDAPGAVRAAAAAAAGARAARIAVRRSRPPA
jgi:hypothetical protein